MEIRGFPDFIFTQNCDIEADKLYEKHDRSYLKLLFPHKAPEVTGETRLAEDLKMNAMSIRLLTAYIKCRYGGDSGINPDFQTIDDIDTYIYYEYDCNRFQF